MKLINKNIYPSGGHRFKESDGAWVHGSSWAGVIARVIGYRKRAGLPPGNPAEEVINQACQTNPTLCHEVDNTTQRARVIASLKSRVLRWLAEMKQIGAERLIFVTNETRLSRVNVCAACPQNHPLPGGCSACKAAVAELRKTILGKRPVDGRLNACAILGEDLSCAVSFEQAAVDNPGLPPQCWRKKTI